MAIKLTVWEVKGNKETFTMKPSNEQLIVVPADIEELRKQQAKKEKKTKKKNKK